MKRRRQVLQVSTFPFLAVLLCAMGSLILLLLVIDRRAKATGRAKALQAAAQAAARTAAKDDRAARARKAEWERRRQALHAMLLEQDRLLQSQIQGVTDKAKARTADLRTEKGHVLELEQKLQNEKVRLQKGIAELSEGKAAVARKARQAASARKDLLQLTEELHRLEQTLEEIKLLRKRDKQTYSLVPYKGRRGESRKPIYIECTTGGLIFHPEHKTCATMKSIRAEVKRQIDRQQTKPVSGSTKKADRPYLLLLVRPDGITMYYRTLAALEGIAFDFGYEFIEQDWVLDFSVGDDQPASQPWMIAGPPKMQLRQPKGTQTRPAAPFLPIGRAAPGAVQGGSGGVGSGTIPSGSGPSGPYAGNARAAGYANGGSGLGGTGHPGGVPASTTGLATGTQVAAAGGNAPSPSDPWRAPSGQPRDGSVSSAGAAGGPDSTGPVKGIVLGTGNPAPGNSTGATFLGGPASAPPGGSAIADPSGKPGAGSGGNSAGPGDTAHPPGTGPGIGSVAVPASATPGNTSQGGGPGLLLGANISENNPAAQPNTGSPGVPAAAGTRQQGQGGSMADSQLPPWAPGSEGGRASDVLDRAIKGGSLLGDGGSPAPTGAAGKSEGAGNGAGSSTKTGTAVATVNTSDQASGGGSATGRPGGTNPQGGSSSGTESSGERTPGGGGGGGSSGSPGGGPEDGPPRNSFTQLLQRAGSGKRTPPETAPFRLVSNRDWIIPVECKADGIELRTARLRYPTAALTRKADEEHPLAREFRELIARRQASVPAGEPPYRPMIRFQVRPDGQYSYYLAYPLLERLHLPMSARS